MAGNIMDDKLVAEIEVNGPIAFNTQMDDIISTEEDDYQETEIVSDDPQEEEEVNEEVIDQENIEKPSEEESEETYNDYSEAALVVEALKKKRPDIFNKDVKKGLKWDEFLDEVDDYIGESVKSATEYQIEMMGDAKEYVDFLLNGGDPKALQSALNNANFSKINIDEASDKDLEDLVRAMYKDLDLPDDEISDLLETAKITDKLQVKAKQAVERFKKKEQNILQAAKEEQIAIEEEQKVKRQQVTKQINDYIDSGNVLGINLSVKEKDDLKNAFFKPTEIIEVPDGKGGVEMRRFTKYQVLEAEFKNSLEKQIAFGKLLLDGFKFNNIKEQAVKERDKDILSVLNNRNKFNSNKSKNAYVSPVGEYDVN